MESYSDALHKQYVEDAKDNEFGERYHRERERQLLSDKIVSRSLGLK